jgi:hypothetical protein
MAIGGWQFGQTQGAKKQKSGVSKDRSDGKKTLNHRGRRGAQRKTFFCHRFALMSTDFKSKPEQVRQFDFFSRSQQSTQGPGITPP